MNKSHLMHSRKFITLSFATIGVVVYMFLNGILLYPFILIQRQAQLLHCVVPNSTFVAKEFGFSTMVPDGYCALPHRQFPLDGTVHIIPQGFYFVVNEYAKGSVTNSAGVTMIFIKDQGGSEIRSQIESLRSGGFVADARERVFDNPNKLLITEFRDASGIQEGRTFNWAFATNDKHGTSVTLISDKTMDTKVFDLTEQSLSIIP